MKEMQPAGFEERDHTADISLFVWGETPEELFLQAALGMNAVVKPEFAPGEVHVHQKLQLDGVDLESLLVAFLSELVYFLDDKKIVFTGFDIKLGVTHADVECTGMRVTGYEQDIKAVTYSDLKIDRTDAGWQTVVVFDI